MRNFKFITLFITLLTSLILAGCGPIYQTTYTYEPPHSLSARKCIVQCQRNKIQCNATCNAQVDQCQLLAQKNAEFQYKEYVTQQKVAGKPVKMSLGDFNYGGNCQAQQSCDCEPQYQQCYQLCGGKVIPHRRCVAFCKDGSSNSILPD